MKKMLLAKVLMLILPIMSILAMADAGNSANKKENGYHANSVDRFGEKINLNNQAPYKRSPENASTVTWALNKAWQDTKYEWMNLFSNTPVSGDGYLEIIGDRDALSEEFYPGISETESLRLVNSYDYTQEMARTDSHFVSNILASTARLISPIIIGLSFLFSMVLVLRIRKSRQAGCVFSGAVSSIFVVVSVAMIKAVGGIYNQDFFIQYLVAAAMLPMIFTFVFSRLILPKLPDAVGNGING